MMDRRFILYMALGVLAFALWSAWQSDYHKPTTVASPTAINANNTNITATTNAPNISSNSIPVTPESRIIKVHTDVLDIAIDTLGGNIVDAALLKYPEELNKPESVKLFNSDPNNYYVAQSGLINAQNSEIDKQTQYKANQKSYSLEPNAKELVVKLSSINNQGLVINKIFVFTKGKYDIAMKYEVTNNGKQAWNGQFYTQLLRKQVTEKKGITSFSTYTGTAISSQEKPYEKISYSELDKQNLNREIQGGWLAMQQRYFLTAWVPNQEKTYHYFSSVNNSVYTLGLNNNISIQPKQTLDIGATLYVGPEITENLQPLAKGLDRTIDYGWLWIISVVLFWIMKKIHFVVGNWGWSIVLVTLLIKLVFYKLSESSCCSMAKMRELAPKIQALKERFGDDRQKLSQATMELYKKEKINPLGGCLPMLVQIPFFIALYYVLIAAVELRQAPFIFWIHDLSVKDPYYILPILMGLSMLLQQKLTPSTPDPAQAKMMMLMPVVFTVFFISFPSGLVLYWLVNSGLSILQQWYINKKMCKIKIKKR